MDATGLIFLVLAVACLFYLVPRYLEQYSPPVTEPEDLEELTQVRLPQTILHQGLPLPDPEAETAIIPGQETVFNNGAAVSSRLTRRTYRRVVMVLTRRARARRRSVLVALTTIAVATLVATIAGLVQWWGLAATGLVLLVWSVYVHFDTQRLRHRLNQLNVAAELIGEEETIAIEFGLSPHLSGAAASTSSSSRGALVTSTTSDVQPNLWDELFTYSNDHPVYTSPHPGSRTVRTAIKLESERPPVSEPPVLHPTPATPPTTPPVTADTPPGGTRIEGIDRAG